MSFKPLLYLITLSLLSLLSLLFVPFAAVQAQESIPILSGTVLDPDGAAVPRAVVILLGGDGAELDRTLASGEGRFTFIVESTGPFRVRVELVGFATKEMAVTTGDNIAVTLDLAPVEERVVVTATRTSAPTAQLGATTTVYTREDIAARNAVTLSDLLRTMPGSSLVRTGGHGTLTSLFVRGAESNHNKILLDGIPLNGPGGEFFLSNLTLSNIERVEVVRGPQSALFGSDAIGDVVQLFTAQSSSETAQPGFTVSFEGGNRGTWQGRGGMSGVANPSVEGAGRMDYSTEWARFFTDNREPNNTFSNTSISGNLGYALTDSTSLRAIFRSEKGEVGTPDATAFEVPDLTAHSTRWTGTGALTLRTQASERWEQRLTYGFAETRTVSQDLVADKPFDFLFDSLNVQKRHHVSYQGDARVGSLNESSGQHLFTFVGEWEGERGFFGDRLDPATVANASRDNFGGVVQHQGLWDRFSLTSGIRLENNASFGFAVVPRVTAAYFVRKAGDALGATKLKFNLGLGIKEPTFVESFSRNPFFLGNPDLEQERSRSVEMGVEQRFARDRVKLEVNLFHTQFRDLIQFQIVDFTTFEGSFFNVQRATAKGGETVFEFVPVRGLRTRGTYTFLDTWSSATERPLLRRAKHSGTAEVIWSRERLTVASTTMFVGKREDSNFLAFGQNTNPGYVRWDLTGSFRSSHRMTYFAVVENLLNDEYMEALGFPALKRMFRMGARVEF